MAKLTVLYCVKTYKVEFWSVLNDWNTIDILNLLLSPFSIPYMFLNLDNCNSLNYELCKFDIYINPLPNCLYHYVKTRLCACIWWLPTQRKSNFVLGYLRFLHLTTVCWQLNTAINWLTVYTTKWCQGVFMYMMTSYLEKM